MMRTKDRFWVILSWPPADLHSQSAPIPDYEQHFKSSSSLLYGAIQCIIECVTHPWPLPVDANITLYHTSHYNRKCLPAYSVASGSLQHHGLQPARLLCPWGFPRQEYWSGLPCPPPGDLPNPGIKPGLPHCRQILYHLRHQESPRILHSLSLLQGIILTPESNWGLLRW